MKTTQDVATDMLALIDQISEVRELNLSNYTHEDVCELQSEIHQIWLLSMLLKRDIIVLTVDHIAAQPSAQEEDK